MTNDHTIENEIQAKGKTAPRVTPADIEANIASEHYFTAEQGALGARVDPIVRSGGAVTLADVPATEGKPLELLTFCVLVVRNGHTVSGESHCQDPAKFNAQIGRDEARKDAINKLWPMVVYAARNAPAEWPEPSGKTLTEADALADLRGEPRPDWNGYSNEKVPAYTWADVAGYEVFQNDLEHTSVFCIRTKDGNERRVTLNNHTYRGLAEAIPQLVEAMNKPAETAAA